MRFLRRQSTNARGLYGQDDIRRDINGQIVLDSKEITMEERNRIETSQIYDAQKAPPMIHYSQYPSSSI